jgi:hypothetical protein
VIRIVELRSVVTLDVIILAASILESATLHAVLAVNQIWESLAAYLLLQQCSLLFQCLLPASAQLPIQHIGLKALVLYNQLMHVTKKLTIAIQERNRLAT